LFGLNEILSGLLATGNRNKGWQFATEVTSITEIKPPDLGDELSFAVPFVSKKKAREGIFVPTSVILELEKMELEILYSCKFLLAWRDIGKDIMYALSSLSFFT
jgi:hypothetical protein